MLELLGLLLALAAALDALVPPQAKSRVVDIVESFAASAGPLRKVNYFTDRLFGPRLISLRSLGASAALTVSISIAAVITLLIAGSDGVGSFWGSLLRSGPAEIAFFGIAILFVCLGDFVSYAQTRLFISLIEERSSKLVTAVLVASDFLASLLIFSVFFAAAWLTISVVLALTGAPPVTVQYRIAPTIISEAATTLGLEEETKAEAAKASSSDERMMLRLVGLSYQFAENEELIADVIVKTESSLERAKDRLGFDFIKTTTGLDCYDALRNADISGYETFDAITNSRLYLMRAFLEKKETVASVDTIDNSVKDALNRQLATESCPLKLVTAKTEISFDKMVKYVPPLDLYLACLGQVLALASQTVSMKFAYFYELEVGRYTPTIFALALESKELTSLGPTEDYETVSSVADEVRSADINEREAYPLPFSLMLFSSLGASFVLWLTLLWRLVAKAAIWMRIKLAQALKFPSISNGIFLFVSVSLSLVCLATLGLLTAVNWIWGSVFSLIA